MYPAWLAPSAVPQGEPRVVEFFLDVSAKQRRLKGYAKTTPLEMLKRQQSAAERLRRAAIDKERKAYMTAWRDGNLDRMRELRRASYHRLKDKAIRKRDRSARKTGV